MKMTLAKALAFGSAFFPVVALAQVSGSVSDVNSALEFIRTLINAVIPILIGIAVLWFIWGVISFVAAGDSEESRKAARNRIIWGIVFIFVVVSVWGLVNILIETFGLTNEVPTELPTVPE